MSVINFSTLAGLLLLGKVVIRHSGGNAVQISTGSVGTCWWGCGGNEQESENSFTSKRHRLSRCAHPLRCALMATNESFPSPESIRVLSVLLPSFLRLSIIKPSLAIRSSPESVLPLQTGCDVNRQRAWMKNGPCPFLLEGFGKFP